MVPDLSFLFVVPTLNSYELLPRLVESFKSQTFNRWRILFVDGPSSAQHRSYLSELASADSRISWIKQDFSGKGIFGAMNQGFSACSESDYLCFWGSDDWFPASSVLEDIVSALNASSLNGDFPDLLVCRGRYVDASSNVQSRRSSFGRRGDFDSSVFRKLLFMGSTPPHQGSLIGPKIRSMVSGYNSDFRLTADLDYFLRLSSFSDLVIKCIDLEMVYMSDAGISGQQTQRRLHEVRRAYRRAFGWRWWFPFLLRYMRRVMSLLERKG